VVSFLFEPRHDKANECAGWSGSMLVANPLCWFCRDAAFLIIFISVNHMHQILKNKMYILLNEVRLIKFSLAISKHLIQKYGVDSVFFNDKLVTHPYFAVLVAEL
jgi:hypothetical protein